MAQQLLTHVDENWVRGLAIVAHPDDLEYGASSAIAKWTKAGKEVVYVLATRGEAGIDAWAPERVAPVREAEECESARLVGVETVEFLDHHDGVVEYGLPLRRDLARAIRRYRPEVVVTSNFDISWPGGGLNQADHRAVGLAVCDAARDAGNRWIFRELIEEGLEPWGGTHYVFVHEAGGSDHGCDVGDALEQGIASLKAHHAYFDNLGAEFDPESFLRKRAVEVGTQLGCQHGVAFKVLRL